MTTATGRTQVRLRVRSLTAHTGSLGSAAWGWGPGASDLGWETRVPPASDLYLIPMHSAGVGGGGRGCHRGEGAVGAGVGFQAGVASLVNAQVTSLPVGAAVVAQGALEGLLTRVRTLVDPHLPAM